MNLVMQKRMGMHIRRGDVVYVFDEYCPVLKAEVEGNYATLLVSTTESEERCSVYLTSVYPVWRTEDNESAAIYPDGRLASFMIDGGNGGAKISLADTPCMCMGCGKSFLQSEMVTRFVKFDEPIISNVEGIPDIEGINESVCKACAS